MAHELNYNELIMLDALAYYKELSDDYNPEEINNQIIYRQLIEFIDNALIHIEDEEEYKTCFNELISDEKNGMVNILNLVKQNPRLTRLEIVYPDGFKDDDKKYKWKKDDTSSFCLVDPITKDVYVIFGGNYIAGSDAEFSTWVENCIGAVSIESGEHKNALRFYKESIEAARDYLGDKNGDLNITVSGHSTAGNMAQYVTIAYGADNDYNPQNDIDRCVSIDGQGFSAEFLDTYQSYINDRADKITSIVPNISIVGSLMNSIPGINEIVVEIDQKLLDMFNRDDLQNGVLKNTAMCHMPYQLLNENGSLNSEGTHSMLSDMLNIYSKDLISRASQNMSIDEKKALESIGECIEELLSDNGNTNNAVKKLFNKDTLKLLSLAGEDLLNGHLLAIVAVAGIESFKEFAGSTYKKIKNFILCKEEVESIYLTVDDEEIVGAAKDDILIATSNTHHRIFGRDGDDIIMGNEDYDYLFGDEGDDVIFGQGGNDSINGGFGNDEVYGGTGDDKIRGSYGEDNLYGEAGNDIIHGDNGIDTIFGGEGNDTIYGGEDGDKIYGDTGTEIIDAANAQPELYDDVIYGEGGNDTINGEYGNDYLYGDEGEDTIDGGSGDDWIYGGEGNDTIIAGSGNDHVWGENGTDTIKGSSGRNSLFGGQGNDTITGGINSDLIWGEEDNDTLDGNYGNDEIFGGVGEDTIDGGYGIDYLYGGRGNDTYIIAKDRLQNYIYDPYGYNHLSFIDLALSDIEMTLSETLNDALDIKIKNTNDVFTIMDFSESYKSFGLEFEDESSSFGKVYYNFTYTNGVVGLDELTGENLYYASTSIGLDRMWRKVNNNAKTHNANNFNHAQNVQPPRDPLVIDFSNKETSSNEGLVNADNGVYFDLDNNGFAEKTAWIDNGKGFLAYDRNGNGVIDNGSELFGDNVIMSNGEKSAHGFEALADLDSNNDGIIDKKDAEFNNLLVWQDTQRNGKTDSGELKTLEQLGIESISLTTENKNHTTERGIIVTDSAEVRFKNNSTTDIAEHWFEAHGYDTQELNVEGDGVSLTSFGNMPSLSNALAADSSGELNALIERYRNTVIFAEKKMLVKKILFFVTGANAIASNSRGGNIDAKKLHVIETIMGVNSFIGVDGNSVPNNTAVPILNDLYTQFENLYLTLLDEEFNETEYIKYLDEKINENGNIVIDSEYIDIAIDNSVQHGNNIENMILSIGSYIKAYDKACGTNCFESFKEKYSEYLENLEEIIETDSVLGTQGNDKLNGTNKSDIFFGDAGNDTLDGGSGNDTYIFNLGDGNDTIIESDSSKDIDSIVFGEGISAEDITISREGDDMILTVGNEGDSIRIVRYYHKDYGRNYRIENFIFKDGSEGYIDINTSVLILTKQPDPVEEDIEQTNAELLNEIYSDDEIGADIFENDSTIISEVTDSITVSDDTDEVSDMTDIQTMILAENMSAFSDDSNVYDNTNITDITADTSALDQLIVSSVQ